MSDARLRAILRWIQIVLGRVVMCYVYSPWAANAPFQILIKFIVVPAGALTGIWIWKFAAFNKLFRRKS
jgi:hypothetical protein